MAFYQTHLEAVNEDEEQCFAHFGGRSLQCGNRESEQKSTASLTPSATSEFHVVFSQVAQCENSGKDVVRALTSEPGGPRDLALFTRGQYAAGKE